jgi:hypothetical protein
MIDLAIGAVIGWFAHVAWAKWKHLLPSLTEETKDGS